MVTQGGGQPLEMITSFKPIGIDTDERFAFVSACFTLGFEFAKSTPGVSQTFSRDKPYEPGENGDVRFYLDTASNSVSIREITAAWLKPDPALMAAEALPVRIEQAKDAQLMQKLVLDFEHVYLCAIAAHMLLFSQGRLKVSGGITPTREEKAALEALDGFGDTLKHMRSSADRKGARNLLARHWKAAMVGWIRAYHANTIQVANLWKEAPEFIKVDKPGAKFPLVLPKNENLEKCLKRWL